MHRLRPSVLLHRPDCVLSTLLLIAGQTLFLWMFLSADPIETVGQSEAALAFAADWRHGMAGNSWVYMPGFFATAAAVWLHASVAGRVTASRLAASGLAAFLAAALMAPVGAHLALSEFRLLVATGLPTTLPRFTARAALQALYTLATWSVFVLACRTALERRTWRPFVLPAILTIGLMVIRPWTVGDFTSLWLRRIAAGDLVACVSAAAIPLLAALLTLSVPRDNTATIAAGVRTARSIATRHARS